MVFLITAIVNLNILFNLFIFIW